jgi:hypothetical protein
MSTRASARTEALSWDSCNAIGLDFAILSIGATGAIFVNPRLIDHWGERTALYGIFVVLVNMTIAGLVVYRRRWRQTPVAFGEGVFDLFLGALALSVTSGVFASGYGK